MHKHEEIKKEIEELAGIHATGRIMQLLVKHEEEIAERYTIDKEDLLEYHMHFFMKCLVNVLSVKTEPRMVNAIIEDLGEEIGRYTKPDLTKKEGEKE